MGREKYIKRSVKGLKGLIEIVNDIIDVLRADGQANRVLRNALIRQLCVRQLGMRRRRRVNDKALHVRDVRQQRENFQAVDKLVRFLLLPLMLKVKMDAPPFGKYFSYSA